MATQGPLSCGTGANDSSFGTVAWNNPGNITSSNNSYADVTDSPSSSDSNYLKATNYGFSIPSGATIDGILVEVEKYCNSGTGGGAYDTRARIVKANGTIGTTDKSSANPWPNPTDPGTYVSYGGATELWGESWTDTDINDADFGFVLSGQSQSAGNDYYVDHIRITIYYTESAANHNNLLLLGVG